jgi:hypothetical protein
MPGKFKLSTKKNRDRIIKIFFLLLLPIYIGHWLFSPPISIAATAITDTELDLSPGVIKGKEYLLEIDLEEIEKPGIKSAIRKIYTVPFDLNTFYVYIEDICPENLIKTSDERLKGVTYNIATDGKEVKLEYCGKTLFGTFKRGQKFTYNTIVRADFSLSPGEMKGMKPPNLNMYVESDKYEKISGIILFFITYLAMFHLMHETSKYIRNG